MSARRPASAPTSRPSTRRELASRGRTDEAIRRAGLPSVPRDCLLTPAAQLCPDPAPRPRRRCPRPMAAGGALCKEQGAPPRRSPVSAILAATCASPEDFWPIRAVPSPGGECGSEEFQISPWLIDFKRAHGCSGQMLQHRPEIKANHVKTRWQETTENDGKPLMISITDGSHGLVYSARKAGALWLTGNVSVCHSGGATEITLKNTRATSNVPMMARLALPSTQSGRIVNNRIKLGGAGWSGTFIGR